MKRFIQIAFLALFAVAFTAQMHAQEDKSKRPSPPATAEGNIGGAAIAVNYSSPAVKGRTVWGGLVPYGEIWRTGANEATTFETSTDIKVEGQSLPAGRYALFTIPTQDGWTIVFNSEADQWGAYRYNKDKDVLRVEVKPSESAEMNERLKFNVGEDNVSLHWDKLSVAFKVEG